jgi:hypothetical protein
LKFNRKRLSHIFGICDNILRWTFFLERDISMIFCGHRHIIIIHWDLKIQGAQPWKGKRKRSNYFQLAISNVKNHCHQEAWNWGGIFKRTDDHVFEKTLNTELSPIPQAYTLKCGSSTQRIWINNSFIGMLFMWC